MGFRLIILATVLIFFATGNAQIDTNFVCGTDSADIESVGELINATWTLKVLLVEFSDVKHRNPNDHRKPAYTFDDWNDLFFSEGEYVSPNMYCPDEKVVYGSMRDYYKIISDGNFTLDGYVLNYDDDEDGVPEWIEVPNTKSYYNQSSFGTFRSAAKNAAIAAGLDVSTSSTVKLAIVYAGQMYTGGGLNPHKSGYEYIMSERFNRFGPNNDEDDDAVFCGIGIHAHEFGHLLGWYDAGGNTWELMSGGPWLPLISSINDDEKSCSSPLPPTPYDRWKRGWISFTPITSDETFDADYNLKDPEIFKIEDESDVTRYFLIECRHAHGTMTIGETTTTDYNHFAPWNLWGTRPGLQDVWLMVYAIKKNTNSTLYARLLQADGFNTTGQNRNMYFGYLSATYWGDSGDIFPGLYEVTVLSPWSFPEDLEGLHTPSSRPTTNVGFEIASVEDDYIVVDFYAEEPENAAPGRVYGLTVSAVEDHPKLTWRANSEPDLSEYYIYRKVDDGDWENITHFEPPDTTYIDYEIFVGGSGQGFIVASYMVKAKDSQNKFSSPSNIVTTLGLWSDEVESPMSLTESENTLVPNKIELLQNFPNPFNPETTIRFGLPEESKVVIMLYAITGEYVATLVDREMSKGYHQVGFDASDLVSGIYLYRIQAGEFTQVKKMMVIK